MHRTLLILSLLFAAILPAAAEEFALKDGTRIVGHMTAIKGDKIEVETAYGKMLLKRSDILTISFPENETGDVPAATPSKKDVPKIEESLDGTQYVNKTGNFSLSLPLEWKINQELRKSSPDFLAGLSSRDNMRDLVVIQEEYSGSPESYKGLVELKLKNSFDNYEKLSESPTTIDGKSALLVSYRGTSPKPNNLPLQFLVAIIPSGNTYSKIVTWCVEPLFNETQPTFEKIIGSYRSTGPASTPAPSSAPRP
jgi:hypothetical protein